MLQDYNLCIIKPNKSAISETFIQAHIDHLAGHKKVLYGGSFPVYDDQGKTLIRSKVGLLSYLFQKKVLNRTDIPVRNKALKNYLINQKIDIVLAEYGMVGAQVTQACQMAGIPLVIHFHGADAHHHATVLSYKDLYLKAFNYAKAIVVVSEDMRNALLTLGAPANKLVLNPYGVNTSLFQAVDVGVSACNFLSVGRFVSKKAPLITIAAFEKVTAVYPDARLWMVGEGPLLESARQKANELGIADKVIFTGKLPTASILELMKKMRCFVQHSVTAEDGDMEGTPNTILEASASALPVISTFHAGIKQAVINNVTGLLADEYDMNGMANNMIMLAGSVSKAKLLGDAGRMYVIDNYNMDKRIGILNSIINNAIS